mmetsp:Transcript_16970/g.44190  ORF Transcript_16970/g.44190 Transcript_16970/m.44190 type:complete len:208 (-) Transcript_16970:840-1463(-)
MPMSGLPHQHGHPYRMPGPRGMAGGRPPRACGWAWTRARGCGSGIALAGWSVGWWNGPCRTWPTYSCCCTGRCIERCSVIEYCGTETIVTGITIWCGIAGGVTSGCHPWNDVKGSAVGASLTDTPFGAPGSIRIARESALTGGRMTAAEKDGDAIGVASSFTTVSRFSVSRYCPNSSGFTWTLKSSMKTSVSSSSFTTWMDSPPARA